MKDDRYYEKFYDELLYPIDSKIHPKAVITKRNEWMIDNSDLLIAYVENTFGGAYNILRYAKKKGLQTINLANKTD